MDFFIEFWYNVVNDSKGAVFLDKKNGVTLLFLYKSKTEKLTKIHKITMKCVVN